MDCLLDKEGARRGAFFGAAFGRRSIFAGELRLWQRDGGEMIGRRCGPALRKKGKKSFQRCRAAPAPRKKGKQVVSEVSRRVKTGRGTTERGKTSYFRGEPPRQDGERHPGKSKSKSFQWCRKVPPATPASKPRRQDVAHKNKSCTNYCPFPSLCAILIKKRTRRYDVRTQYTDS